MKATPVAVLISDIHYSLSTLTLADTSLRMAIDKAAELGVSLIVAGDLNDTKAIIRGEVANALLETMRYAVSKKVTPWIVVGNHDRLNEKAPAHSLNFLSPWAAIVDKPDVLRSATISEVNRSTGVVSLSSLPPLYLLPYFHDLDALKAALREIPPGSTIIMHQGVQTAFLGHYVQDQTSLPPETFADYRVVSGHYHRAQDIKCGRPKKGAVGLFSYIGSPYTTSFAEANDGPKGFQILMSDGLLQQVPTNLRKHVIVEMVTHREPGDVGIYPQPDGTRSIDHVKPGDLLWVKLSGPGSLLSQIKKNDIGHMFHVGPNFKFDLIKTDSPKLETKLEGLTDEATLDALIESSGESEEQQAYLKKLWKEELA